LTSPPAESRPTHKARRIDPGDFGSVTAPAHAAVHGSRTIEARQTFLILGTILLLGLSFYGGTKPNYVKYLLASRNAPRLEKRADRFTEVAADDLVKQALNPEVLDQEGTALSGWLCLRKRRRASLEGQLRIN
jgi:hypothetical protein